MPLRMDTLRQDLAYAFRRLRQAPGFTLVAVATLALGIGANTAIFSVVNGVLLKPLPYPGSERLVAVSQVWEGKREVYSPPNFLDVQSQSTSFESIAAYGGGEATLTGQGEPVSVPGAEVSASFFGVLGVQPLHGRFFRSGENDAAMAKILVLGHALWMERFGGDPAVIGRAVTLDRKSYTVVGVAPQGFAFPDDAQLWSPLGYDEDFHANRGAWYLSVIGRLKPGVSVAQADAEVATIAARLAKAYPDMNEGVGGAVGSLRDALVGDSRRALLILMGAVGLVLLIACVNVANLMLARVVARETELAVRTALGAGRIRLIRQLLTESLLIGVLGGLLGLALASFGTETLIALQARGLPRTSEIRLDGRVLAFAASLAIGTGLLFGLVPALLMARRATAQSLREGGRGLLRGRGGRLRGALVIGEIALAMMLLAGAGLLIRSFNQLRQVDPGFHTRNALTFRLALPEAAYADAGRRTRWYGDLLARLAGLPGVEAAGAVTALPLSGSRWNFSFEVDGRPKLPSAQQPTLETRVATLDYFGAIGLPLLRGRTFATADRDGAPQVVLLSEAAARRHFPGEDPIGRHITLGWGDGEKKAGGEIVGIVGDVKELGLGEASPPQIYLPYAQQPVRSMTVVLRTSVPPLGLAPGVRRIVAELDPSLPIARLRSLDEVMSRSLSEPRFYTLLLGAFAGSALLLAALGIFGVMSYAVAQREREIGIRVALGAHPRDVLRLVLSGAAGLATLGVGLGLLGSLALSRILASLLFNLSPTDPLTFACVALALATTALLASALPALRATRVDPLVALRSE
jgi:putative ABC transport system permease protein